MGIFTNLVKALVSAILPQDANETAQERALGAMLGLGPVIPEWLVELNLDAPKALAAEVPGALVVAQGGHFDGTEAVVMARLWAAPNGGNTKGTPIWASTEYGKLFAWIGLRAPLEDKADTGAWIQGLNPETGEAEGGRGYIPEEVKTLKLKLDATSMSYKGSYTPAYARAVAAIERWLLLGDGTRKDLVVIAQFAGKAYDETGGAAKLPTGNRVQPISAFVMLEVPRVSAKDKGTLEALGLSSAPVRKRAAMADAADATADQASARVTSVMPVDVSPLASADEL